MKRRWLGCALALVMLPVMQAAEGEWLTDFAKAEAKAKAEKKLVFMDFTGSDWCPPCKALHSKVLTSPEFVEFAKDNLVLVMVDFPQGKPQSKELQSHNEKLAEKFKVEGFPTVIVIDGAGKELKREVGYSGVSGKDYVASLKKLKK